MAATPPTPPQIPTPTELSDLANALNEVAQALPTAVTSAATSTLSTIWAWLVGAATGTGIVALIARAVEKRVPTGDALLKDRGDQRRETASRINELEEELRLQRAETTAANERWLISEQLRLKEANRATIAEAAATLIRKNVEHPEVAFIPAPSAPPTTTPATSDEPPVSL